MMTVSAECQSYYVTRPGEEIMQGRGRCPQCAATQVSLTLDVILHCTKGFYTVIQDLEIFNSKL